MLAPLTLLCALWLWSPGAAAPPADGSAPKAGTQADTLRPKAGTHPLDADPGPAAPPADGSAPKAGTQADMLRPKAGTHPLDSDPGPAAPPADDLNLNTVPTAKLEPKAGTPSADSLESPADSLNPGAGAKSGILRRNAAAQSAGAPICAARPGNRDLHAAAPHAAGQDLSAGGAFRQRIDRHTSTKAYRMLFIGTPLIAGGVVMQAYDSDFRRLRNGYSPSFRQTYDDWLQYAPAGAMLALKACGVRGRSSWGRMLVSDAFSTGLMAVAVNSLKYSCRVLRPDGSSRNSFPSGHTATAFMAATMLHKEYGHRSPWYSICGYTVATVTGVTRQLNNRHWMSDVMVGAGIGILATELGYFLADLIFRHRGLLAAQNTPVFDRFRHPSFFGFGVGCSTVPGSYTPYPGMRMQFISGPAVGVQGAWFASPYWGFGGRMICTNLRMKVNGVAQNDNLECASMYAGPYFSYPVSLRWQAGAKLLGGCEIYKACDTHVRRIESRAGFSFGTGVSATYLASEHLGVRFSADYDAAPPLARTSRQRLHKLTFTTEVCAVF